jgi:hypothetical protein
VRLAGVDQDNIAPLDLLRGLERLDLLYDGLGRHFRKYSD